MTTDTIPIRPNGHSTGHSVGTATCWFCGSGITDEQAKLVETRSAEIEAKWKKEADDRVNLEKQKRFADSLAYQQELENLRRRLARERPNELGEAGECNLFNILRESFGDDDIVERVGRFKTGPDIIHRVMVNGTHVGTLIFDSKNGSNFQSKWIAKIAKDRKLADAVHAVIVSAVMPRDTHQLAVVDQDVVVVQAARVVAVTHLLRRHVVETYRLRLSASGRSQKSARIYALLTASETMALWQRHATQIDALIRLEQADAKHQDKTRTDRLQRIEALRSIIHDEFVADVDRLIGGGA
jgi:hypothetical protein